ALAQTTDAERLQTLERQLQDAQQQIRALQRAMDRHAHPSAARRAHVQDDERAAEKPAAEPVDLLLDTLRKQGTINEADYQQIKRAIEGKRAGTENALPAAPETPTTAAPVAEQAPEPQEPPPAEHASSVKASYTLGTGLLVRSRNNLWSLNLRNR